jgi:hypothetical protein
MREGKQNKTQIIGVAVGVITFTSLVLAVPLKSATLEPSTMFLLGFGLIGLRIFISHRLNKMNQLPAKTH